MPPEAMITFGSGFVFSAFDSSEYKAKMAGETIKAPERQYTHAVKENNVELIEKAYGTKMELVENEQALPMSEKRKAKYD